jgi:pimeloyl-ACP methyl ester carboxylesterase
MTDDVEVIDKGAGPRVVLVHGDVFGCEMTWETQEPLAADFHLQLVNRRGFGNSADTDGEDFEIDAVDVADLLEGGAHLVGHSYGGVVALLAAASRPRAVRSLVVFEPPAFALTAEDQATAAFIADIKALIASDPSAEEFLARFITAVGGDPARVPQPLPPPLRKAVSVQLHGRWPWEAQIPLDVLAPQSFPKLVVSGGHSALFDGVCDVLEAELPAQRVVLAGAGHSIPTLGPAVNDVLSKFWNAAAR